MAIRALKARIPDFLDLKANAEYRDRMLILHGMMCGVCKRLLACGVPCPEHPSVPSPSEPAYDKPPGDPLDDLR